MVDRSLAYLDAESPLASRPFATPVNILARSLMRRVQAIRRGIDSTSTG